MGRSALALVLVAGLALADEPRMYQPATPTTVVAPDWILKDEGRRRIAATLEEQVRELEQLRAENASLKTTVLDWEKRPALTWGGALLLVGGGLVLGALVAIPIATAARR